MPARQAVVADDRLIPTGEYKPMDLPDPAAAERPHAGQRLQDLVRGDDGRAVFWVQAGGKKVEAVFGPKYRTATIYAPAGRDFICFEPMAGMTDATNLNHAGKYPDLQMLAPGAKWSESFWVRASGF